MKDSMFVIIVPMNSTLTTHGKIIVELERNMGLQGEEDHRTVSQRILLNQAVILIRDTSKRTKEGDFGEEKAANNLSEIEYKYWQIFREEAREVETRTTAPSKICYNVLVESKWQEPLACRCCYPADNLLEEKPIIEVNRASVVPMILAGPKESSLNNYKICNDVPSGDIKILKEVMCFGHGKRKNDHFQYYFKTDQLIQLITENEDKTVNEMYNRWLNYVKSRMKESREAQEQEIISKYGQNPYIYDILVAPMHETNAEFIGTVNDKVFQGVPLVLYIDSDREYRENILSKYSNLTALYYNIRNMGRRAVINFHFIDDTINAGGAFRRTHSLLYSLFPDEAYQKEAEVQVNLFQSIVLLINRNSDSTIKDYIQNGYFFSYFNLKISSLRNHHDNACMLCSQLAEYKKLEERSSVTCIAMYWEAHIANKGVKDVNDMKHKGQEKEDIYFRRLLCTHEINRYLGSLGWDRNVPKRVTEELDTVIINRIQDDGLEAKMKLEYVMAYITVLSKPYLIYRKSILDVVFPFLLKLMESILEVAVNENRIEAGVLINYITDVTKELKEDEYKDTMINLLRVMITCIAELRACYLIRLKVLNRMFRLADMLDFDKNEFALLYGAAVKKIITLSKDESIGLWLEHLVVHGYEYRSADKGRLEIDSNFKDLLFYENTYIIADAVDEMVYKKVSSETEVDQYIGEYYFENFRKMMNLDYYGNPDEPISKDSVGWQKARQILLELIRLKCHLTEKTEAGTGRFYEDMLNYMKNITGAKYVFMCGIDIQKRAYIIGCTNKRIYSAANLLEMVEKRETMDDIPEYLKDSVFFYSDKIALICLTNTQQEEKMRPGGRDSVWIVIQFSEADTAFQQLPTARSHRFAVRNILVHRYHLWNRLQQDFKENSFDRIKELSIKNELLSRSKAGSHTPDAELNKIEKMILKADGSGDSEILWGGSLLQLASDSLVSKMYVESIRDEGDENVNNIRYSMACREFVFQKILIELLEEISFINKEKSENEPTYARIRLENYTGPFDYKYPTGMHSYLLFMIAALIQNAVKHGRAGDDDRVEVAISLEGKYLVMKNTMKIGWKSEVKEDEGITVLAMKHYFNKYYQDELQVLEKESGYYAVGLPVIEKGE